jgi:hypothetical protein
MLTEFWWKNSCLEYWEEGIITLVYILESCTMRLEMNRTDPGLCTATGVGYWNLQVMPPQATSSKSDWWSPGLKIGMDGSHPIYPWAVSSASRYCNYHSTINIGTNYCASIVVISFKYLLSFPLDFSTHLKCLFSSALACLPSSILECLPSSALELLHSSALEILSSSVLEHLPSSALERLPNSILELLHSSALEPLSHSVLELLHSSALELLPSSDLVLI